MKSHCFLFLLCIWLSIGLVHAQQVRTAQDWMQLADKEPDPQKALEYYKEVLKIQPDGLTAAEAYNASAVVRSGPKVKAFKEALEDINRAIYKNKDQAKYYAQRAYIYVQLSEYERAAKDYQEAIARAPKQGDYYSGLSYCQTKHGKFDEAEATAQKGIDLNPKSPYAYRNRGRARLRKGMEDAAIQDFQTSITLKHGQLFRVYCDLGEAYEQKGQSQLALKHYQQSLDIDPDFADALVGKKQLEIKLKLGSLKAPSSSSTFSGKRVALVMGNSFYPKLDKKDKLRGQPINDAKAIQLRFRELGFDTVSAINATTAEMRKKLDDFYQKAKLADVALIFYAGHGVQYKGENFLLPVDVPPTTAPEFEEQAISVTTVIDVLQKQDPKYCVFIIDACRQDPFDGEETDTTVAFQGFKPIYVENRIKNCYVALATAPGFRASNGPQKNGFYTASLLNFLHKGRRIDEVFREVRKEVATLTAKSGRLQQPEFIDRTIDDLVL